MNQKELFNLIDKNHSDMTTKIGIADKEIKGVTFRDRGRNYERIIFHNCVFRDCVFDDAMFIDCNFYNCAIYDTPLFNTKFIDCHMNKMIINTGVKTCRFVRCEICDTDFSVISTGPMHVGPTDTLFGDCFINHCDFSSVDMPYACKFNDCNFEYTNFTDAIIRSNIFTDCKFDICPGIDPIVPEEGSFIGFKKCRDDLIVKLKILESAKRSSGTERKCRASKAKVLAIYNMDGDRVDCDKAISKWDAHFVYRVGEIVEVDDFYCDRWHTCAPGIHFFLTFKEAVNYDL